MGEELTFSGVSIAPKVFDTVVRMAAEKVEGVACVGAPYDAINSTLASLLTPSGRTHAQSPAVGVREEADGVAVAVHVSVFFGYPFLKLADAVREAVASAVSGLIGVDAARVDVFVDAVVFAKE